MWEYVKYRGETIKIGTCEALYYATYPKYLAALTAGMLSADPGGDSPGSYALPDSGYLFRFPFPDEDHIPLGRFEDFNRGIRIKIDTQYLGADEYFPVGAGGKAEIEIVMQKLIHRKADKKLCLALIVREPLSFDMFWIESDAEVKRILDGIIRYHISGENDPAKKNFYRKLAARVLAGYKLNIQQQQLLQIGEAKPILKMEYKNLPATKNKKMGRRHR